MENYWKQTGMSLQTALKSGLFNQKPAVSAFAPSDREEYQKIIAAVKAEWESVE